MGGTPCPLGGGYHHHIGLTRWAGRGAPASPRETTGLYHFAVLSRTKDARRRRTPRAQRVPLEGAADHGVSEAIYFETPTATASSCIATGRRAKWREPPTAASRAHAGAGPGELLGEAD